MNLESLDCYPSVLHMPQAARCMRLPQPTSVDSSRCFGNLLNQLPETSSRNFVEASIEVEQPNGGKASYPAYRLTRDGFTLLAMASACMQRLQQRGLGRVKPDSFSLIPMEVAMSQCTRSYPVDVEDAACAEVQRLARELVIAPAPISHVGDGNCGVVFEVVVQTLASAGLYVDPKTRLRKPPSNFRGGSRV